MFEWQGCKLMMPTLFCTQSDRVSAAQSWRLARMKCFYNSYQQQCFVAQRIFFNPTLASWLPTKAVLWKEVFAPCLLFFFSALSLVQSSNGGQISKIGFLHLNDDGSCWTTTLQFLPPTTKRKSTIGDATLTHTHTHLHTEPSHGAHRPHVCTPPPFCSTNGKICPFPQASNLKPSPLEHLWHFELAQVDQAPPASRLKLLQGFGHLELVQLDQAPRASRLKLLQCLWHLELAQVDQVL